MLPFDQTPDKPQSFGYKVSWLALKASDPAAVCDALELPANWEGPCGRLWRRSLALRVAADRRLGVGGWQIAALSDS